MAQLFFLALILFFSCISCSYFYFSCISCSNGLEFFFLSTLYRRRSKVFDFDNLTLCLSCFRDKSWIHEFLICFHNIWIHQNWMQSHIDLFAADHKFTRFVLLPLPQPSSSIFCHFPSQNFTSFFFVFLVSFTKLLRKFHFSSERKGQPTLIMPAGAVSDWSSDHLNYYNLAKIWK